MKTVTKTSGAQKNREVEMLVLGATMLEPSAVIDIIRDHLTTDSFYFRAHRTICEVIFEMDELEEPIDMITVANRLEEMGKLGEVGGRQYLSDCILRVSTTSSVEYYVEIIAKKQLQRSLSQRLTHAVEDAARPDADPGSIIAELARDLDDIERWGSVSENDVIGMTDALGEAHARFAAIAEQGYSGIPTGFRDLDKYLGGLPDEGSLTIITARPKVGKTALATVMAVNLAATGRKVGYISLEMSLMQIISRALMYVGGIEKWQLTSKVPEDAERRNRAFGRLNDLPLYFYTKSPMIDDVVRTIRKFYLTNGCSVIFLDLFNRIDDYVKYDSEPVKYEAFVRRMSTAIKKLFERHGLPLSLVLLAQPSREAENYGRVRLHHLKWTGKLEEDASLVLGLHRPDLTGDAGEAERNVMEVDVLKNRDGEDESDFGAIKLRFTKRTMNITDYVRGFS